MSVHIDPAATGQVRSGLPRVILTGLQYYHMCDDDHIFDELLNKHCVYVCVCVCVCVCMCVCARVSVCWATVILPANRCPTGDEQTIIPSPPLPRLWCWRRVGRGEGGGGGHADSRGRISPALIVLDRSEIQLIHASLESWLDTDAILWNKCGT